MKISVSDAIKSEFAINQVDGEILFGKIKSYFSNDLTISFEGISHISTAFLNESIGKFALINPENVNQIKFIFPKSNEIFEHKINDVIENALMGEEYSKLVDNALKAY